MESAAGGGATQYGLGEGGSQYEALRSTGKPLKEARAPRLESARA